MIDWNKPIQVKTGYNRVDAEVLNDILKDCLMAVRWSDNYSIFDNDGHLYLDLQDPDGMHSYSVVNKKEE